MRYEIKHHQRTIETQDPATFDHLFEEAVKELADEDIEIIRNMNKGTHCVYLTWAEKVPIPEDLREEYELRGDGCTCGDCPELEDTGDGRKKYHKCPMCDRRSKDDRACLRYYRKLEAGEI